MNKRDQIIMEQQNLKLYRTHIKGHMHPRRNVILISTANSLEHELEKLRICYEIKKRGEVFITEAYNKQNDKIDVINISTGEETEIIKTHGEKKAIENDRTVVYVDKHGTTKEDIKAFM